MSIISQFLWRPYIADEIVECLPSDAFQNSHIWKANTALICFQIVEWHQPDRVLRQFGMQQAIPQPPMNLDEVHRVDMRGNHAENWAERHANWIRFWKKRSRRVVQSPEIVYNNFSPSDEYIRWFYTHGRPFIFPSSGLQDVRRSSHDQQTADLDPPMELHRRSRRPGISRRMNLPTSAEVDATNAPRMSFSHPAPERDLGASSSRRHSFSHARDDDGCYRPEPPPPISRLDANLLPSYRAEDSFRNVYQFGTPMESGTFPDFGLRRPSGLGFGSGFLDWVDISRVRSEQPDSMPTQEETTEEDAPAVEVRAQRRQTRGVRGNEDENVQRRVLPPRNRRAPHCCSTPRDRAPRQ